MISATSPAAKNSPVTTEATRAMATRTSALISCSNTTPRKAPTRIGTPHRMIAAHAISTGRTSFSTPVMLRIRETAEISANADVSLVSFSSHLLKVYHLRPNFGTAYLLQNTLSGVIISYRACKLKNQCVPAVPYRTKPDDCTVCRVLTIPLGLTAADAAVRPSVMGDR